MVTSVPLDREREFSRVDIEMRPQEFVLRVSFNVWRHVHSMPERLLGDDEQGREIGALIIAIWWIAREALDGAPHVLFDVSRADELSSRLDMFDLPLIPAADA